VVIVRTTLVAVRVLAKFSSYPSPRRKRELIFPPFMGGNKREGEKDKVYELGFQTTVAGACNSGVGRARFSIYQIKELFYGSWGFQPRGCFRQKNYF
jgi:hypothetical protein